MDTTVLKTCKRATRRGFRIRKRVRGTTAKPRLSVIKSNSHLHAQIIDDEQGLTIASLSTISKEMKSDGLVKKNQKTAAELGKRLAKAALDKGVKEIVFDRGQWKYHGVLATLADAAREAGLKF